MLIKNNVGRCQLHESVLKCVWSKEAGQREYEGVSYIISNWELGSEMTTEMKLLQNIGQYLLRERISSQACCRAQLFQLFKPASPLQHLVLLAGCSLLQCCVFLMHVEIIGVSALRNLVGISVLLIIRWTILFFFFLI